MRRSPPVGPFVLLLAISGSACSSGSNSAASGAGGGNANAGQGNTSTGGHGNSGGASASAGAGGAIASGGSAASGGATSGGATSSGGNATAYGPTLGEFLGVNGFIDDPPAQLAAIGNVREYHSWVWNDGNGVAGYTGFPQQQLEFSLWSGFWDFDAYYQSLHAAGVEPVPCIQGSVDYLKQAVPPVAAGADTKDPASYAAHASLMFQYAARYGGTKVDASKLLLKAGQVSASGLGTVRYFENSNEPDANWVHANGSPLFAPEELAAMTSADYDGHRGALGAGFGIKAADPNAQLVLSGLAGAGTADFVTNVQAYVNPMIEWAKARRGGSFPADVLNIHYYCFGPDAFGVAEPRPGIAPEACQLKELMGKLVAFRDQRLPGKALWLSEFGYDTHPRSRLRAPAIGGNSAELVQAAWLVRSVLALMASGIERAFVYTSRDNCTGDDTACPTNNVQFSTSGILTQKGAWKPKPAWYFLATLRARLGSYRFVDETSSGALRTTRFYDPDHDQAAYVVWSATSDGSAVPNHQLSLPGGVTAAKLITLVADQAKGLETSAAVSTGSVTLSVTETPSIVLFAGKP